MKISELDMNQLQIKLLFYNTFKNQYERIMSLNEHEKNEDYFAALEKRDDAIENIILVVNEINKRNQ